MEHREAVNLLLKEGHIKAAEEDLSYIAGLIQKAREDISKADELSEKYFDSIRSALRHSGLALMFNEGFRPVNSQEESIIYRFAGCLLNDECNWILGIWLEKRESEGLLAPEKQLDNIRSLIEAICRHIMINRDGNDEKRQRAKQIPG